MTKIREAGHTVAVVDDYCSQYRALFSNVRHFEQFTALHVGLLAETKRKSLPRLAKTAKADPQALHHFLANADWSGEELRTTRLALLQAALGGRPFILCLDETGDRKKGKTTDYVAHQYIGNIGGLANGVVSVNAYGVLDGVPFPLTFRVYKPKTRLKPGDVFTSKPQLAIDLIQELHALGLRFSVVLADSMYGESGEFTAALHRLGLQYVVAIRSNHPVWTGPGERKRYTRWRTFDRVFADGSSAPRFIREVVFGPRRPWQTQRFFQITTDTVHQPPETTWYVLSNLPGNLERSVGDMYGWRTWIEYGFKQAKDELGWADYRLTDYQAIARWWELVMSAATLVALQSPTLVPPTAPPASPTPTDRIPVQSHPQWDGGPGWKRTLNNLRLLLQPFVCACLLLPWLRVVPLPHLQAGLADLCAHMNVYHSLFPT
jgi:SRSO17 transposase